MQMLRVYITETHRTVQTLKEGEIMKLAIFSTLTVLAIIGFAAAEALTNLAV